MDGRVAVITGVGRQGQVGETVAGTLASLGARCILLDRTAGEVQARAAELRTRGFDASAHACDLTDAGALDQVVSRLDAPEGVHALVCLAGGFVPGASVAETAPDTWQRLMSINLTTAYLTTRAFIPLVRQGRGSIVYFASAAAIPGGRVAGMAAYAAAKTGVVTLMRAVAAEEKKHGVRANALAPTSIRTATNVASMGDEAEYVERDTVAEWVAMLCSEEAGPISGQVVKLG
jgi:NAD(P)-dependent dehydrogenase (short-subunit alcohol dehydrogenase family)